MKEVEVAVGIITRADGAVFLQQRAADNKYYPHYWEFPGGKIEKGETPAQAMQRELQEEIGISVQAHRPWLCRRHTYPHATVRLHFFRIEEWQGEPEGRESQNCHWQLQTDPPPPLLPASELPWRWLSLPSVCAISAAEVIGVQRTLQRLPQVTAQPVLLQLRDKNLSPPRRERLAQAMAAAIKGSSSILMINDDEELAAKHAAGLHLSSRKLMQTTTRPSFQWTGASCHTAEELNKAAQLNLDYAILSPVAKTLTHVETPPLGWQAFASSAQQTPLPLYALGGLKKSDLPQAQKSGAQGIAMMRKSWQ